MKFNTKKQVLVEGVQEWQEVSCKEVYDADGFLTDYTWYTNGKKHIFMFGDKEVYFPDELYADWEVDVYPGNEENARAEAQEWFDSYKGFEDDMEECLTEDTQDQPSTDVLTESGWAEDHIKLSPERQLKLNKILDSGLWDEFEDAVYDACHIITGIHTDELEIENNNARTEGPYITEEDKKLAKETFYRISDEFYDRAIQGMLTETKATDAEPVTLEVKFDPYARTTRFGSDPTTIARVSGKDLRDALARMVDRMSLYVTAESIRENPNYTVDAIIDDIASDNGAGADFVHYIKDLTNNVMLFEESDVPDEIEDWDDDLEEGLIETKATGARGRYQVEVFDEGDWHKLSCWSTPAKAFEEGESAVEAVYQDFRVIDKETGEEVCYDDYCESLAEAFDPKEYEKAQRRAYRMLKKKGCYAVIYAYTQGRQRKILNPPLEKRSQAEVQAFVDSFKTGKQIGKVVVDVFYQSQVDSFLDNKFLEGESLKLKQPLVEETGDANDYEEFQRILYSSKRFEFEGTKLILTNYRTGYRVTLDLENVTPEMFEELFVEDRDDIDDYDEEF